MNQKRFFITWEIDIDDEDVSTHMEAAQKAFNHIQEPGTIANVFIVQEVVDGVKGEKVLVDLMELEDEDSDDEGDDEGDDMFGVAGFGYEDYEKLCLQRGYILTKEQIKDLISYSYKDWDATAPMSGWDQLEIIVSLYCSEKKFKQYEELFLAEDGTPLESGNYTTDKGSAYYDPKNDKWTQDGEDVELKWWRFDEED